MTANIPPPIEWRSTANVYFCLDEGQSRLYCWCWPGGFLPLTRYQVDNYDCACGCIDGTSGQPSRPPVSDHLPGSLKTAWGE